eukprot:7186380-Pyramimonas_sp.AAC.1
MLDANAEVGSHCSAQIGDVEAVEENFSGKCMRSLCHRFQAVALSTFLPAPIDDTHNTHVHTD